MIHRNSKLLSILSLGFLGLWLALAAVPFLWTLWGSFKVEADFFSKQDWRNALKVIFPNNDGRGTHVNVSGMAMAKYAPNREAALKLMEYLTTPEAQAIYAEQVFEYPINKSAKISDVVASFGVMNPDNRDLNVVGSLRSKASLMVDRVRFNDGPR